MVTSDRTACPKCGGELRHYDTVTRILRTKARKTEHIKLRRLRCEQCLALHRVLPDALFPYKQYDAEVIRGVLEGFITFETPGYEDYPCEMTTNRWKAQKEQILLWKT